MFNLSSGINLPSSLEALLPDHHTCQRGKVRYAFGIIVIAGAVALNMLAGVTCILSRLTGDKSSALAAEYQQYLNDHIIANMSDAYKCSGKCWCWQQPGQCYHAEAVKEGGQRATRGCELRKTVYSCISLHGIESETLQPTVILELYVMIVLS